MEALQKEKHYTYADYEKWDSYPRCELIDGVIYLMSVPTEAHQWIGGELFVQLKDFLRGKSCRVYYSPFDVRLNYDTEDDIVVQPDILVVCDRSKLENGKYCLGAPDFIIEILSPFNNKHDTIVKLKKYLQAGVKEYWVVDPDNKTVVAHRLMDKQYVTIAYGEKDDAPVTTLEGCIIRLNEVFT